MNGRRHYILCTLATGLILVTVWSLLDFWGRWLCIDSLADLGGGNANRVDVSPLGLLADDGRGDPNVLSPSHASAVLKFPPWVAGLGILDYAHDRIVVSGPFNINQQWGYEADRVWACFDKRLGLIVQGRIQEASETAPETRIYRYAGPDGVAATATNAIGRFRWPVVGFVQRDLIVFDKKTDRFYSVSFDREEVRQGPKLGTERTYDPIQIGQVWKFFDGLSIAAEPRMRRVDPNEPEAQSISKQRRRGIEVTPTVQLDVGTSGCSPEILVLDASGRIDLLDQQTLEIVGQAGWLPAVPEMFARTGGRSEPRSLSMYSVKPVAVYDTEVRGWRYVGCAAAAMNRNGSAMTLAVYDKAGMQKATAVNWLLKGDVPGATLAMATRFALENLHCPVLSILSLFTASWHEGGAAYRSIFTLPDSFSVAKVRYYDEPYGYRFVEAIGWLTPGILVAVVLAAFVTRRARAVGFTKDARTRWILATVAFGVPAYVTYRLTEPRIRRVTCANCGKLRRPDLERCHYCNAPWNLPELIPPTWRVFDSGEIREGGQEPVPEVGEPHSDAQ